MEIKLYVPLAIPGLRLLLKFRKDRKTFIKSYVKSRMLTHDREQARRYDDDALIAREIAANVLVDLHDASARLIDDAGAIRVPTLDPGGGGGLGRNARPSAATVRASRHALEADEGLRRACTMTCCTKRTATW